MINTTTATERPEAHRKGRWAEQMAERWLASKGLTPHSRNYHRRLGEIDLVLRDETKNTWVFVEVKFRGLRAKVSGIEAITAAKQRRLRQTAELFLQRISDQTSAARIDVVVITREQTTQNHREHLSAQGHTYAVIDEHSLLWIQNAIEGAVI